MSQNTNVDVSRRSFLRGNWSGESGITSACLNNMGVYCQSCKDVCSTYAISFNKVLQGIQLPSIISDRCTHCQDCVECCPVDAITISKKEDVIDE